MARVAAVASAGRSPRRGPAAEDGDHRPRRRGRQDRTGRSPSPNHAPCVTGSCTSPADSSTAPHKSGYAYLTGGAGAKGAVCDATAVRLADVHGEECVSLPADLSGLEGFDALAAQLREREEGLMCSSTTPWRRGVPRSTRSRRADGTKVDGHERERACSSSPSGCCRCSRPWGQLMTRRGSSTSARSTGCRCRCWRPTPTRRAKPLCIT